LVELYGFASGRGCGSIPSNAVDVRQLAAIQLTAVVYRKVPLAYSPLGSPLLGWVGSCLAEGARVGDATGVPPYTGLL
jgi:hypothetical protein